jgi:hypothetical protein
MAQLRAACKLGVNFLQSRHHFFVIKNSQADKIINVITYLHRHVPSA